MNSMNYKGCTARVEFDAQDGIFLCKVLELPVKENITFEGDTVSQLTQNFCNAIDSCLADCGKMGHQTLKPASGKLMLRVDPKIHGATLIAAQASGHGLNQWDAEALAHAAHI